MKKKRLKKKTKPVPMPENCQRFWVSHGLNFLVQSLQMCIGGGAACIVVALLCSSVLDPKILLICMFILLLFPLIAICFAIAEAMIRKRHDKPIAGLDKLCLYLNEGTRPALPLDRITSMHYHFGQLRKRGKFPYICISQKSGVPIEFPLPSLGFVLALRRALPSLKLTVRWIFRLIVCLLLGFAIGGIMALLLLVK